jgi:hypothetical protein
MDRTLNLRSIIDEITLEIAQADQTTPNLRYQVDIGPRDLRYCERCAETAAADTGKRRSHRQRLN